MFSFKILHVSRKSQARVGLITTPHGTIETPAFVPVATNGVIKGLDSVFASAIDIPLLFCNTYHLMVHPGADTVAELGGIHRFMKRDRPVITDSGGFQIFSLAYGSVHEELKSNGKKKHGGVVVRVSEEGVLFRSYRNGELLELTPEVSIKAQKKIGADIILPLDELLPYHIAPETHATSFARTHRWQIRSLQAHKENCQNQALYGIIHGGIDLTMRLKSLALLAAHPFDGMAIGGSLGKNLEEMSTMLRLLTPHMPPEHPRHLLGIADQASLACGIPLGLDTFDSCYPTRVARHGLLLAKSGSIKIMQTKYRADKRPIEEECRCHTCSSYSRSYVHHLFKSHELSAYTLATIHNLTYMSDLMKRYREAILRNEV